MSQSANSLLPAIQLSITPVILISGVSGLMITLTGRMSRVVDRTRVMTERMRVCNSTDEKIHIDQQMVILVQRAYHIRKAVMMSGFSMLAACLQIVVIFLDSLMMPMLAPAVLVLFAFNVGLLIYSLIAFLFDVHVSLAALQLEVEWAHEQKRKEEASRAPFHQPPLAATQ